ncbi:MAG: hypothetical protein WDN23_17110 [Edaphobacter sp.]
MNKRSSLSAVLLLSAAFTTANAHAQFDLEESHTTVSLRGIHSVGRGIAWASGTNGTVLRTEDGGYLWQTCTIPPGAEKLDFRGIQAFDENTAIVMSSGPGDQSRLYKTTDGCQTWKLVFTNPDKEGFWDAISMQSPKKGWVLGDPVNGQFSFLQYLAGRSEQRTVNGRLEQHTYPDTLDNAGHESLKADPALQGAFAASNSALFVLPGAYRIYYGLPPQNSKEYVENLVPVDEEWFGTGGVGGAFVYIHNINAGDYLQYGSPPHISWNKVQVPLHSGTASSGVFALCFYKTPQDAVHGIAVGGDYLKADEPAGTAAYTLDGGRNWQSAQTPPHGYRSSVAYDPDQKLWITVGPNGTDISRDDGKNWTPLKPTPQEPPDADKNWNALSLPFVVGQHGRIGRLHTITQK